MIVVVLFATIARVVLLLVVLFVWCVCWFAVAMCSSVLFCSIALFVFSCLSVRCCVRV